MGESYAYGPPSDGTELATLLAIQGRSFRMGPDGPARYRAWIGDGHFRVVRDPGGTVVGGLAFYPMGQWFQERSVPSWGVAAVAVAPEARGRGAAGAAMRGAVREMHACGVALSSLYPATAPLYRKSGYDRAGGCFAAEVELATLGVRSGALPVRRLDPVEHDSADAIEEAHRAWAASRTGSLDRAPAIWRRIRERGPGPMFGYRIGPEDDVRGWVYFTTPPESAEPGVGLRVHDWGALDGEAGRGLWALLGGHAAQIRRASLRCAPDEPLLGLLPGQDYTLRLHGHWMLRVVDVRAALEERGYPPHVRADLVIAVDDDLVGENRGPWTLRVADGRGTVERGGTGGIALDVRALAPLYTGFHDARDLHALGRLRGDDRAVATARALFSGRLPSMADTF